MTDEGVSASKGYAASAALFQVSLFLALPGYRAWALLSVLLAAISWISLKKRSNKILFVVCYIACAVMSFMIGQFFTGAVGLTKMGGALMLGPLLMTAFVGLRAMAADSDAA